jgi:hypothetical protein
MSHYAYKGVDGGDKPPATTKKSVIFRWLESATATASIEEDGIATKARGKA